MRLMWAVLFLLIAAPAYSQQPVWVYLRPEAVHGGKQVTGERARPQFENDRAIPPAILLKIARAGAHVRTTSRWLQAVSVDADAATIHKLKQLREVQAIGRLRALHAASIPTTRSLTDQTAARANALVDFDSAFYGFSWKAVKPLGVPAAHTLNYTGQGIRIAILDGGFNPAHEALGTRRVIAQKDFINKDNDVRDEPGDFVVAGGRDQAQHGTWVWSVLGGYAPGKLVGPAFDATFILAKVDVEQPSNQDDFKADEDRWVAAVEWADSMGARIISSSLAYLTFIDSTSYTVADLNGDITASARLADEAARRGILIVNAMGNNGPAPTSLWTPADADSIIAVGAVDSLGQPASFSGRGPTADGRLKPELAALGVNVWAAAFNNPTGYNAVSGTSLATPLISGIAGIFMQAWPNLTIMAVRSALLLSGSRATSPDFSVGYGVPDVAAAILFPEGINAVSVTDRNLQNELTTIQPTFTWSVPLVRNELHPRYTLQVATDPAFTNIIYTDTTSTRFSLTTSRPLRPAAALYWRVVGEAFPNIKRASQPVPPFVMPNWVKLLTLNSVSLTTTDSLRPVFKWEPLAAPPPSGPLTYDVEIMNAQTGIIVQTIRNLSTATIQPPEELAPNVTYTWRVIAHSALKQFADTVSAAGNFVVKSDRAPNATLLYQNFPNPFPRRDLSETSTHVWFDVNTRTKVELAVYDVRGRLVKQLIPGASSCGTIELDPGSYGRLTGQSDPCVNTSWDGTDTSGKTVPRGVYMLRLRAGGPDQVKKILFLP